MSAQIIIIMPYFYDVMNELSLQQHMCSMCCFAYVYADYQLCTYTPTVLTAQSFGADKPERRIINPHRKM